MIIFFCLLLAGSLIYLLVGLYTQNELKEEQAMEIEAAKEALQIAESKFRNVSEGILGQVAGVYGEAIADDVRNSRATPGMPEELLLLAWGEPEAIESGYIRGTNTERWYYDGVTENEVISGYKTEVVIINNVISEIFED